jgi:GntR family transcriptional regulator, transcriptional repressor for pyruvate dehydrogenase complex
MFKPVARRLLASEVFDQIRSQIVRGEMVPGASLPAERVLATLLNVNRNAVREGLKRLQQAGLVAIQQGGSTRVLDYRRSAGLEVLATMVVGPDGGINTRVVRGILELRTDLAPIVGKYAAERATPQQIDRLRATVRAMRDAKDDTAILVRLALDFWAEVVTATDNLALELAFNSLATSYGSVLDQARHVMSDEIRAVDDYDALVTAIGSKQPIEAGNLARKIVLRGQGSVGRVTNVVDAFQRIAKVGASQRSSKKKSSTKRKDNSQ